MDNYIVHAEDEDVREYEHVAGSAPHRRGAEDIAIAAVRSGRRSAVVQRMRDGLIMAYFDREEVDNIT